LPQWQKMLHKPLLRRIHPQGVGRWVPGCYAATHPLAALPGTRDTLLVKPADCGSEGWQVIPHLMLRNTVSDLPPTSPTSA
jgi:hypothetical protein